MNEESVRKLAAAMRAAAQAAKAYSPDAANAYDDCASRVDRLIPKRVYTPASKPARSTLPPPPPPSRPAVPMPPELSLPDDE